MDLNFVSQINVLAVGISSIVFFFLGSLWYSVLFGEIWAKELKAHHVTIQKPTKKSLMEKMLITIGTNIVASLAMAFLVVLTGSYSVSSGFTIGVIAAVGFAATTLASTFTWENRSIKLFFLDVGYPVLGIISSAIILSVWH
jgi:hypothetical protein